ncbi:MAG: Uma2 family endonuclease, partial [Cyanobacteria bacterium P01_F01_bin.4]
EEFVLIEPDTDGIIRSSAFPGLWLAVPALLAGNMFDVLNELQTGLTSSEHQTFVNQLSNLSSAD